MADLQLKRGTTLKHSTFTGKVGEATIDTDKDTLVVHDGSTVGGFPLARESQMAALSANVYTKEESNTSLALKVDKLIGKGLSTEDYTTVEKSKLAGIADNANNYTLPVATSTVKGGVELYSDTVQTVASNVVSTTASRTYGIQLNSDGQAVVNVPWVYTNTVYTHPTTDGSMHVPATGTVNSGKVLTAGATAGSFSWVVPTSGVTDHTLLTNIGTNTHAQIDTALTRLVNTSGTNTGDNAVNTNYASDYRAANFIAGTNYQEPIGTITGIAKGNGANSITSATVRVDYAEPTTALATGILKNTTTTGVHSIAVAGTDYLLPNGNAANLTSFPTFNQNTTGSAATLTTARTIGMTGDVTWTSSAFNGSANVTGVSTLATITDSGSGLFKKITINTKGLVTGTTAVVQSDILGLLGAGSISNTMLANSAVANLSGTNTGDQIITLTGDVTGSGTGSFSATLKNTGVSAGTYKVVTVDLKGRITSGTNPTTISGFGISDAYTKTEIDLVVGDINSALDAINGKVI